MENVNDNQYFRSLSTVRKYKKFLVYIGLPYFLRKCPGIGVLDLHKASTICLLMPDTNSGLIRELFSPFWDLSTKPSNFFAWSWMNSCLSSFNNFFDQNDPDSRDRKISTASPPRRWFYIQTYVQFLFLWFLHRSRCAVLAAIDPSAAGSRQDLEA